MYSVPQQKQESYSAYKILINGKQINPHQVSVKSYYHIILPLYKLELQNSDSVTYFKVKKLFHNIGLEHLSGNHFLSPHTDEVFRHCYKKYLSAELSYPVNSIQVYKNEYRVQNRSVIITQSRLLL
jgi:hypothetical protein